MRASRRPLLCLTITLLAGVAHAQETVPRLPTVELYFGISHADTTRLRGVLADEVRWVLPRSGAILGKSELLAEAAEATPFVSMTYWVDSLKTWQHGDVVAAEYRLTNRRTYGEYGRQKMFEATFLSRVSAVFVMRDGRWQLVRHAQAWIARAPEMMSEDSVALASFAGLYQRGKTYVDEVHFVDGHLVLRSMLDARLGAPGAHLYPVSTNTFSPDRSAPMIVFERDATGRVTGYVQQQPDGAIARARRLFLR
jgi:hypothetical protein